jgi:hypothetical protein
MLAMFSGADSKADLKVGTTIVVGPTIVVPVFRPAKRPRS